MRFDYGRDLDYCGVLRCGQVSVIIFSGGSTPFIVDSVGLCEKHHEAVMRLVGSEGASLW